MQLTHQKKQVAAGVLMLASAGLVAGTAGTSASAADDQSIGLPGSGTQTHARLDSLNNSGVRGKATVTVQGRKVEVSVDARHLVKGMPHAMHFHFSAKSEHECPTVRDDKNSDHRLNTVEGIPSYGAVRASLTTRGDHSPKSALAVNRFPKAKDHQIHYDRTFRVSKKLARAIERGDAAVVIHGIDYNQNGKYDFSAGKSDLDPSLPAEATDPVACGVLHESSGPLSTP
ncbi:hypothetical protein [Nocardioides koreensis]